MRCQQNPRTTNASHVVLRTRGTHNSGTQSASCQQDILTLILAAFLGIIGHLDANESHSVAASPVNSLQPVESGSLPFEPQIKLKVQHGGQAKDTQAAEGAL